MAGAGPSIEGDQAAGIKAERRPWPGNKPGLRITREEMARRIRDGIHTPSVRAMAGQILRDAGFPKSVRDKAEALRQHVKKVVDYAPDPPMSELVASAPVSLCLDGALCMPIGDCDDMTVACQSLIGAAGMDARFFHIDYGDGIQVHMMGAVKDERGDWLEVDVTTDFGVGHKTNCRRKALIDPFDAATFDIPGDRAGGSFIGVGKPHEVKVVPMREAIFGARAIGAGATPMDVLRYRVMWDQYVLDTVSSANECASAFAAVAAQQTDPALKSNLAGQGQAIGTQSADILALWNTWHDQSDASIVVNAEAILKSQQDVVLDAGALRQQMTQGPLTCALTYHDSQGNVVQATPGPDQSTQAQVIAYLEGLGIIAGGSLQILGRSAGGALQETGSAAQYLASGTSWLLSPWTWAIAGTLLVGSVVVIVWNADKIANVVKAAAPFAGERKLRGRKSRRRMAA